LSISHYFQVQDQFKAKPFEIDLSDYFQDVDTLLAIAFQIALHNHRKQAKASGEEVPPSRRHGKAKQALLRQGDGAQGESAAEALKKRQGELSERRKRDEMVRVLLLLSYLY
jgi:hypothetical protein